MSTNNNGNSDIENPGGGSDATAPGDVPDMTGDTSQGAGPEDPDASSAESDAVQAEADQQSALDEAGVSEDLVALRDAVEKTLLGSAGTFDTLSDSPSSGGIVGVGIGLSDPDDIASGLSIPGAPVLTLFTETAQSPEVLMASLAKSAGTRALSSLKVHQMPIGVVDAFSHRARHRPAPGGVSVGHTDVTAGTLGSRAIGMTAPWNNRHVVVSNNHVIANTNAGRVGDSIIQPGRVDGGQHPRDQIAILSRWVPIRFGGAPNIVDAAFGWAWHQRIRGEQYYLSGGNPAFYKTGTSPLAPQLGALVGKSGRTTGLTQGRITQIGVSVNVNFGAGRIALFRNQIAIRSVNSNPFSAPGDSGSLVWRWATGVRPVGLLFAGGGGTTFANPIGSVLAALNIRLLP